MMSLNKSLWVLNGSIFFSKKYSWSFVFRRYFLLLSLFFIFTTCSEKPPINYPSDEEVREVVDKVYNWQEKNHKKADWHPNWLNATLYHGIIVSGRVMEKESLLSWATEWANHNEWKIGGRKLNADDQASGLSYLLLYELYGEKDYSMVSDFLFSADSLISFHLDDRHLWYWCDALYMVPPAFIKASELTGKKELRNFTNKHFWKTYKRLYSKDYNLFFRDSNYLSIKNQAGNPIFWSRGNGWVIASLVNILKFLPQKNDYYQDYLRIFIEMMDRLVDIQPVDGLWRTSLFNPSIYPTPETSGSSFFCYGLAWGINNEILSSFKYKQALEKVWWGLVSKVDKEGKLGWVQGVASKPGRVDPENSEIYATGAFLLASSEMYKLVIKN